MLDALAKGGGRQREDHDVIGETGEGSAKHLHTREGIGEQRQVGSVLLDSADIEDRRSVRVALGDLVDLLPGVVGPVAFGGDRAVQAGADPVGKLLEGHRIYLRHHTAEPTGSAALVRAASAGRTCDQNRPSCPIVSCRRIPGRCGKMISPSRPSSSCISRSVSPTCSGVPTTQDLEAMRSLSVKGGRPASAIRKRTLAGDGLINLDGGIDRPGDQGELRDRLGTEGEAFRRNGVVLAPVSEPFIRGRGFEDLDLLFEHLAVVDVVRVAVVADVDAEHVRLALLGATSEAAEYATTAEDVGHGVVFGEPDGVPGGEHVDQGAEPNPPGVLGEHGVQEQDVRDDLEAVVLEMVLGRPNGLIAELVADPGVLDQVREATAVVLLAVAAFVGGRAVDADIRHVHGPVEEGAKMHAHLPPFGTALTNGNACGMVAMGSSGPPKVLESLEDATGLPFA